MLTFRLQTKALAMARVSHVLVSLLLVLFGLLGNTASAQTVRLEGLAEYGYPWSRTWIDVNGDGKDDYCMIVGNDGEQLWCYLSDGTKFGPDKLSFIIPPGRDPQSVFWLDLNGDGRVDICRSAGVPQTFSGPPSGSLECRLGPDFVTNVSISIPFHSLVPGRPPTLMSGGLKSWGEVFSADADADGRTDVCYLHDVATSPSATNASVRCLLSNGAGVGPQLPQWISQSLNDAPGEADWPRGMFDFDGDGFPDYCRIAPGPQARCLRSGPGGFTTADVSTGTLGESAKEGAAFVDVNGDGNVDFCRYVGLSGYYRLSCQISNGVAWQTTELGSPIISDSQVGDVAWRWWVDINGDGFADFCRLITEGGRLACRLSRGDGDESNPTFAFGFSDVYLDSVEFGYPEDGGRSFCDASGTGIRTYCRPTFHEVAGPSSQYCFPAMGDLGDPYCFTVPPLSIGLAAGLIEPATAVETKLQARLPLMTALSDGVGAETRISYFPLTNQQVYSRSGVGTYPRALIVQPRSSVVYETRSWRTGSSTPTTGIARYMFKDLRQDAYVGSRGFRERWIFTEASNTLDHIVFYQGLGPTVDASSILDDQREIGMIKMQERFAVANGYLPTSPPSPSPSVPSQRIGKMITIMSAARSSGAVQPTPSASAPFILLQRTTNTLADTTPNNSKFRFVGASTVGSWDWNNELNAPVPLPSVLTTTAMTDIGNVTQIAQTTTAPNGLVWTKTTNNEYAPAKQNTASWILGRLTKSTVVSTAPTAAEQLAQHATKAGASPGAGSMSSTAPAVPQPLSPAVLNAILQLLLDD